MEFNPAVLMEDDFERRWDCIIPPEKAHSVLSPDGEPLVHHNVQSGRSTRLNCCGFWNFDEVKVGESKVTVKTFLLMFFLFVIQRTCGATMVQYYADSIFEMAHSSIKPSYATVLLGVMSCVGSAMSITATDNIGRRFLLTFSFFIMALSMVVFLVYVSLFVVNENLSVLQLSRNSVYAGYVPAVTLGLFLISFRLGVSPIPWFLTPEIIPTEAQKWAPSFIVCFTWGTSFLMSKSFLPAVQVFGQVAVYTFFLLVCVIGFMYTLILIPETKNKSREEIQRELGATVSYDDL